MPRAALSTRNTGIRTRMFSRLDHTSPRANIAASVGLKKPLFLHQQADLEAMVRLERSSERPVVLNENESFWTRCGLLCDKPGSGKSYTMIAHILAHPTISNPDVHKHKIMLMCNHASLERKMEYQRRLDTNLVLVPRGTLKQWDTYLREMTGALEAEHRVFYSMRDSDEDDIFANRYKTVVMGEASYKKLISNVERFHGTLFQRFIIDEADSIHVAACTKPHTIFTWFITATPRMLVRGSAMTVAFRHMFQGASVAPSEAVVNNIIVASTPMFVDQSLQLPNYLERTVEVERTTLMNNIRPFMTPEVMSAINACDFGSAISRLGCATAQSEDGIVAALTAKLHGELATLQKLMETAPTTTVVVLARRVEEIERKVALIADRVRASDCCPIGLDTIVVKALTPCCQNAFEFANLMRALHSQPRCPLCKTALTPGNVVVFDPNGPTAASPGGGAGPSSPRITSKPLALTMTLSDIFSRNPGAKVLIFSEWDMTTPTKVLDEMGLYRLETRCVVLWCDRCRATKPRPTRRSRRR